jgi:orotidine-5'-phosphate decarboxylase
LDPVLDRIPQHVRTSDVSASLVAFLGPIIEATRPFAAAFKINTAFFEQYGLDGLRAMYAVRDIVGSMFCIIDAKRGDIGSTSAAYARAVFNDLQADAVTVAPYMGSDSVEPFLDYEGKVVYILALTSNPGSADVQRLDVHGEPLYMRVMHAALSWKGPATRGFVVGATHPDELRILRERFHEVPFLIPGIGAQGGDVASVVDANAGGPALFNSSRGILYAHDGEDFAEAAASVAKRLAESGF